MVAAMSTLRLLLLLLWLAVCAPRARADATLTGGPMVGATTDTTTAIWVRADGEAGVRVDLRPKGGPEGSERHAEGHTRPELDHTAVVTFTGLQPDTAYEYAVSLEGAARAGPWTFRTLPAPG